MIGFNRLIEFDDFRTALKALTRMPQKNKYTCNDYREEMRLIGLKKRLSEETLNPAEKQVIEAEIDELEKILDLN